MQYSHQCPRIQANLLIERPTHGIDQPPVSPGKGSLLANHRSCYNRQYWVPRWKRRCATWTPPPQLYKTPLEYWSSAHSRDRLWQQASNNKKNTVLFRERERERQSQKQWNVGLGSIAIAGMQNQALVKYTNNALLGFFFDLFFWFPLLDQRHIYVGLLSSVFFCFGFFLVSCICCMHGGYKYFIWKKLFKWPPLNFFFFFFCAVYECSCIFSQIQPWFLHANVYSGSISSFSFDKKAPFFNFVCCLLRIYIYIYMQLIILRNLWSRF